MTDRQEEPATEAGRNLQALIAAFIGNTVDPRHIRAIEREAQGQQQPAQSATPQLIEPLAIVVGNLVARYVEPPLRIEAVDDVLALLREVRRTPNPVEREAQGEQPAPLDVAPLGTEVEIVGDGSGEALPPVEPPLDEERLARAMTVSLDIYGWDLEAMAREVAREYDSLSDQPSTEPAQGGERP